MDNPYRHPALVNESRPTGHPLLDQVEGVVLDPGTKVSVYHRNYANESWRGQERVVIRCSTTHLESMCPILKKSDIKIVEWDLLNRWLPAS